MSTSSAPNNGQTSDLCPLTIAELDLHTTALFSLLPLDDVDFWPMSDAPPSTYEGLTPLLVARLCRQAGEVMKGESTLLRLSTPINVCGDIHGQFDHLLYTMEICGRPPASRYLFLGDYIDRGRNSLETMCLLLLLKCRHPQHMYLLRGNHECRWISRVYGCLAEVEQRYGDSSVWHALMACLDHMPLAAVVDEKIFCVHGGISPHLRTLHDIEVLGRGGDLPGCGLACDLLWADPIAHPLVGHWANNHRQVSYTFGPQAVANFCAVNSIDFILRAHQAQDNGYRWSACGRVLTVFTAPNYCCMGNDGCVVCIGGDGQIQLRVLRQRGASFMRTLVINQEPNDGLTNE